MTKKIELLFSAALAAFVVFGAMAQSDADIPRPDVPGDLAGPSAIDANDEQADLEADDSSAADSAADDAKIADAAPVAMPPDTTAIAIARAKEELRLAAEANEKLLADERAEAALERRRISTKVFELSHASAEEVAAHFNATWSGDFGTAWKITQIARACPEANAVMVTAPQRILEACESVVKMIDREARQVYIEARFVELGNTASHKLGIDWSMLDGMKASASFGGGYSGTHVGKGVNDYTRSVYGTSENVSYSVSSDSGRNGNITHFNGTLNFSELSLTLQALEATEDARIFSNPKIIVSSGKRATVDMTTKYPNVFVSAKRTNSGQNINSLDLSMQLAAIPGEDKFMFAKEAFFSWGIQLEVVPRVGTNGLINVTIVPTISDLDPNFGTGGFVAAENEGESDATYASKYPIIKVQRLITEFNMASGSTAVIGGLSRTVETQRDTGIPGLRALPWIGSFFGSKVRVKEQREILVFVTVGLVDPKRMTRDAGLPKNAVLGRQYVLGQRLEPGERPEDTREGMASLDLRPLDEQARQPLPQTVED